MSVEKTNTPEQQKAIESIEKRVLVLAAAGSGKTTVLIDRIIHLINKRKCAAKNILVITFTNYAETEVKNRLVKHMNKKKKYTDKRKDEKEDLNWEKNSKQSVILQNLTISTFHHLGKMILDENGHGYYDNKYTVITDKEDNWHNGRDVKESNASKESIRSVLRKSVISACQDNPTFYQNLQRYLTENKFLIKKEIEPKEKKYKNKRYICLNGIEVKSKSEQKIVDWFITIGIDVVYEPLEVGEGFFFQPDFKLIEKEFYIEHKSNRSAPLTKKIQSLRKEGKPVFVTYEEWMQDSSVIEKELMKIFKSLLICDYTPEFSKEFDNKFRFLKEELIEFLKEVIQAYDIVKSHDMTITEVENMQHELLKHHRIKSFHELFPIVWRKYEEVKRKNSLIDFNDMISIPVEILKNDEGIRNYYRDRFKCILVDEFQDVNKSQMQLINCLLGEDNELFCVGDDWQSIYGFRGSDVTFIVKFEHYFPGAAIYKLAENYRSNENIVRVGNEVIKHNKFKIEKEVISTIQSDEKVVLFRSDSYYDTISFVEERINFHLGNGVKPEEILILGRTEKHYKEISGELQHLHVRFSTIHGSKGLESKVVFITALRHSNKGFPNTWLEDSIFQVFRKSNKDNLLEEERRMFYVAITRARDFLYLLSENENQSQFIDEIPEDFLDVVLSEF